MTAALSKTPIAIGIAAGSLIGGGSALGADKLFGGRGVHGQELTDARIRESTYKRELKAGREDGNLTVKREKELERLIDGESDKISVGYGVAGVSAAAAVPLWMGADALDEKRNFTKVLRPGFQSSGYSLGLFDSADKMVTGERIRYSVGPPAMKALAVALPVVAIGAALAHQILE